VLKFVNIKQNGGRFVNSFENITMMKRFVFYATFLLALINLNTFAQKQVKLPHGMVFGTMPSTVGLMPASQLESFMGKRTRISTAIVGKVLKVTNPKEGWFTIDAGKGKVINARFKTEGIGLPSNIKGREVIISGVATKQFNAFDAQREAGSAPSSQKKANRQQPLAFEAVGLMVNK
jgi:hypothetical protein